MDGIAGVSGSLEHGRVMIGDIIGKWVVFRTLGAIHFVDNAPGTSGVFPAANRVDFFGSFGGCLRSGRRSSGSIGGAGVRGRGGG